MMGAAANGSLASVPSVGVLDREVAALMVGPLEKEHTALEQLFQKLNWRLYSERTIELALCFLRANPVPLVIAQHDLWLGDWNELLLRIEEAPVPPLLIVASPQADDRLWAQVLNTGGHDVLMTPFRMAEVHWVMRQALETWQHGRSHVPSERAPAAKLSP